MSAREGGRVAIRSPIAEKSPAMGSINPVKPNYLRKPSYRWQWFGNKGVALALLWTFSAFFSLVYVNKLHVTNPQSPNNYKSLLAVSLGGLLFPIMGWLTDILIGRYRVIKVCLLLMWFGSIVQCITEYLHGNGHLSLTIFYIMIVPSTLITCAGIGGFLVNIIQFSVDQLLDSSSSEIISYITWFVWTLFASLSTAEILTCLNIKYIPYYVPHLLFLCSLLTLSVCSDFLFKNWLVKEPVTHNPLRLIFIVLHYAATNRYPRLRSSFPLWDERRNSRLDLAKTKYGGPFITREVEDVKTLFRVLSIACTGSLFLGILVYCNSNISVRMSMFSGFYATVCSETDKKPRECLQQVSVTRMGYLLLSCCIPLYEIVVRPILWRHFPHFRIITRVVLGGTMLLLYLLGLVSLEVVGTFDHTHSQDPLRQKNVTCYAIDNQSSNGCDHLPDDTSYYWLAILSSWFSLSFCLVLTAGIEFICSQVPYRMKGLTFGCIFTVLLLSLTLTYLLFIPFQWTLISIRGEVMGCLFWFLLSCSILAMGVATLLLCVACLCYKNRERDDDEESETS